MGNSYSGYTLKSNPESMQKINRRPRDVNNREERFL